MKLIIDIPDEQYEWLMKNKFTLTIPQICTEAIQNGTPLTESDLVEHAKAIKDYCRQRDNLDDCCEDCQFHFYDGYKGKCIFNYGLYPNEWFNPNAEGRTDETDN